MDAVHGVSSAVGVGVDVEESECSDAGMDATMQVREIEGDGGGGRSA